MVPIHGHSLSHRHHPCPPTHPLSGRLNDGETDLPQHRRHARRGRGSVLPPHHAPREIPVAGPHRHAARPRRGVRHHGMAPFPAGGPMMSGSFDDSNSSRYPRPPTLAVIPDGPHTLGFEFVYNWVVVNNDAGANTLTVTDITGTPTVYTIPGNSDQLFEKVPTYTYVLRSEE